MLKLILGQDGSSKRYFIDFTYFSSIFARFWYDWCSTFERCCIQFSFDFGSITRCILRQNSIFFQITAFRCAQNNHTCEQWQHENNRSTGHRQWPAPVPLQPLLLRFRPECLCEGCWNWFCPFWDHLRCILQPNTKCFQIAVFKCVKNNHTCEQWQH